MWKEDENLLIDDFYEEWLQLAVDDFVIFSPKNTLKFPEFLFLHCDGTFESSSSNFKQHLILIGKEYNDNESKSVVYANVSHLLNSKKIRRDI